MPMVFPEGPYLSAAFLCEKLLHEQDGVKSAIRIVDRTTVQVRGPHPAEAMEPIEWTGVLFIRFKSGHARGPMRLRVMFVKPPPGAATPMLNQVVHFEGEEDRGLDFVANVQVRVEQPGMHWYEVYLDDGLMTRVPWRVTYLPIATPEPSHGQ